VALLGIWKDNLGNLKKEKQTKDDFLLLDEFSYVYMIPPYGCRLASCLFVCGGLGPPSTFGRKSCG